MTNARTKLELKELEVFLNKDLKPIYDDDTSQAVIKISYQYENGTENLKNVSFTSNLKKFPNFELSSKFIERFMDFNRPDEKTLEILRKNSLKPNGIISLKKYAFECKKYIEIS